jgi:hypothetical protein
MFWSIARSICTWEQTSSFFRREQQSKSVHPAYTIKQRLLNHFQLSWKVAIGSGRKYCQEVWSGRKVASTKKNSFPKRTAESTKLTGRTQRVSPAEHFL